RWSNFRCKQNEVFSYRRYHKPRFNPNTNSNEKTWIMTNQELLKVYSAYLPYGVKIQSIKGFESEREMTINGNTSSEVNIYACVRLKYKMLLRPLSDLTKEIEHNGER